MEALHKVMSYFAEQKDQVFKTITGDNGSEFAELSLLEDGKLKVYFTHPYSSCERAPMNATTVCYGGSFPRERVFPITPPTKSASSPIASTACP